MKFFRSPGPRPGSPREVAIWWERVRQFWNQRLDALGVELARGERENESDQGIEEDT
ncbi:hypothetical protein Aph01nite_19840 [Acrocarpospora phusangensis]|uniref:Uncharacterized protein n=1 Tax=Acrocarpospora phusangensis TaxID=1070424 RepID=A0A919UJ29_9ACTN|nr:hypothetical protein [Acrocarpospora phusangensis]GIH23674.1 hypothetical protein Aph01nite_19840 [Acrocarpospora phusangensis]